MALLNQSVRYVLPTRDLDVHELEGTVRPERSYRLDFDRLVDELNSLLSEQFERGQLDTSRGDTAYSATVVDDEVTFEIELTYYPLNDKFDRREHRTPWHAPRTQAGGDSVSLELRSSNPDVVGRVAEFLTEHGESDFTISEFS